MADRTPSGQRIGANDPCFCGSNLKYKRCCRNKRRIGWSVDNSQIAAIERFQRSVANNDHCYHPNSPEECDGKTINAHTVSKSQNLKPIAEDGIVVGTNYPSLFEMNRHNGKPPRFKPIGLAKASTFHGFCSLHDKELFSEIEDKPFQPTSRQMSILCYRTLCREIRAKESQAVTDLALIEAVPPVLPANRKASDAVFKRYLGAHAISASAKRGHQDLLIARDELEKHIFSRGDSPLTTLAIEYSDTLPFVVSGAFSAILNPFTGDRLQILLDHNTDIAEILAHCISRDSGSVLVLSYRNKYDSVLSPIFDSILSRESRDISSPVFEWIVSNIENIFFNPTWYRELIGSTGKMLDEWSARNTDPLQEEPELPLKLTAKDLPLPDPISIKILD